MLTTLMGAAVFSVGFFMLILGLLDLLQLSGLRFGGGERVLLYMGGIFLCILGYIMARRLPRAAVVTQSFIEPAPMQETVQTTEIQQAPPEQPG